MFEVQVEYQYVFRLLTVAEEERWFGGKDSLAEEMTIGKISHEDCKDEKMELILDSEFHRGFLVYRPLIV